MGKIVFRNTVVIITFFLLAVQARSQITVSRVEINPLNKATIYCSEKPTNFKSQLSVDKKKITINIYNAKVEENARKTNGQGIIQDVYIQNFSKDLQASIILKERRGYTILPLDYSQALVVEVFRWEDIQPAEDAYREGILALKSGLYKPAKDNFIKSAKNDYPNAAALLGILLLKEGKTNTAYKLLKYADAGGSDIPDLNACLAQIYYDRVDKEKAEFYSKKFTGQTKKKNFPLILIPDSVRVDSLVESELGKILDQHPDSVFVADNNSTTIEDSLSAKQFPGIFGKDSTKIEDFGLSIFPKMSPLALTVLLIIILGLAAMLALSYFRWRKAQIDKIQRQVVKQNREKVKDAIESLSEKRKKEKELYQEQLKKKQEALEKEREKRKKTEEIAIESEKDLLIKQKSKSSLADRVENIANKIIEEKKRESGQSADSTTSLPAKVELALHLQQEQNKLKRKSLENIDEKMLLANPKKLTETAKKLGIDIGMLETKQSIEKIKQSKDQLDELGKKFKEKGEDKP